METNQFLNSRVVFVGESKISHSVLELQSSFGVEFILNATVANLVELMITIDSSVCLPIFLGAPSRGVADGSFHKRLISDGYSEN